MRGHPSIFAHFTNPMDAEDCLHASKIDRELYTTHCEDREKVMYGPHQLRGTTKSWWESYLASHTNPDAITWKEFRDNFQRYHVLEGLFLVKKKFLALKQGAMSVSEYRERLLQLSRYAPKDVNTDAKR